MIVDLRSPATAREIGTDGFRITARWSGVPAVAGVATAAGVARLAADPTVVQVGLDLPGHGAGAPELAPSTPTWRTRRG